MPQKTTLPNVPAGLDPALYDYLSQLHAVVVTMQTTNQAPAIPSNLTVTPIAGGNVIQFTRSSGLSYNLYLADTSNRAAATQVNLGSAATYTDNVGTGGKLRYYWLEALNGQGLSSGVGSPRSGTTLALGTPAAPLKTPPQSIVTVFDTTIDRNRPVVPASDTGVTFPLQESIGE